jgi:hypothetical protein
VAKLKAKGETVTVYLSNPHNNSIPQIVFDAKDGGPNAVCQNKNVLGRYLHIDFRNNYIIMTHYTIQNSNYFGRDVDSPRTWTIEGSNCGQEWTVLDSRTDIDLLRGACKKHRFECNRPSRQAFRYIRLYQRGVSWDGTTYHFMINRLEFFGDLLLSPRA